jgi:NRAMP (natural resistance-associated macrophage protein)-like metal ion transporter
VLAFLAVLGPGLIAANAGNDAGGILTYASAGSQFGYRTLFLMVLITVALVVVQEMCSRLGAYTGMGLGALIREQFPLRSGASAMLLLFVANAGLTVSEFAGVGASMEILGVSRYVAVPIALFAIWAVTVLGNYARAERVFLVMGLVFLTYPVSAFLGHPHASTVFSNLLWPHFLHSKAFLLLAVALIGTTITPYMQFYLTSAVVDKGVTPETYRGERFDTINGAIISDVVSVFIIIATAAAIGGHGALNSAGEAAAALRPVAGAAAEQLFAVGLLGASLLAATVVPLSSAYAIAETAGVERSLSRKAREAPLFYGLYTTQLVIGAAAALLPGNAVELVVNSQVLNGFITPVLLSYILILANRPSVLGDAANGPRFRVLATICVAVVGVLSAIVLVQTVAGWL